MSRRSIFRSWHSLTKVEKTTPPPSFLCPILYRTLSTYMPKASPEITPLRNDLVDESAHDSAVYQTSQPRHQQERPRWEQTPPRMVAPYRAKAPVLDNEFHVNENPSKLDNMFESFLGKENVSLLTDEVKWLVVTHKSFDHGRRGFNDRLAYLGRRIVELQVSLALTRVSPNPGPSATTVDEYGRRPFQHFALEGVEQLTQGVKTAVIRQDRIAKLASKHGLDGVVRWKPKNARNLKSSGISLVTRQALYAIVGAIALQRGGEVANHVVRERILDPLGVNTIR